MLWAVDGVLQTLGVDPMEERVYTVLLEEGSATTSAITAAIGVARERVRRALEGLESKGLASRSPGGTRSSYTAARPDLAIEALVLRRQEELTRARREAAHFVERFKDSGPSTDDERRPIELVRGREAVAQWWVQVQRSAQREVLIFDRPPYVMPFTGPNPVEIELLKRGVHYRVLYDESSFDQEPKRAAVQECIAAGEEARIRVGLPIKLLVADEALALTHDGADVHEGAVVMRRSAVLSGLVSLFNAFWRDAAPLGGGARTAGAGELDDLDEAILSMLAAGSKDERIARQLRLSVRTVRRRITRLTNHLGAETRFQAAVIASRKRLV
jgi:sugar-specific transcriptional regulator TrmB/DNA-binding CsgD family transcriptional regulator